MQADDSSEREIRSRFDVPDDWKVGVYANEMTVWRRSVPWIPPHVTYRSRRVGRSYTIRLTDPAQGSANGGSGPERRRS